MGLFTYAQEITLNERGTYNGTTQTVSNDTGITSTVDPATPLSSAQYLQKYGSYGQNAIVGSLGARQVRSAQTFRSTVATISYDVVGGYDDWRGAQVGVITNYVDDNNFLAACVQRADYAWESGDLTLTIVKVKSATPTLLAYTYFKARNTPQEPTKWLSLSVLPANKRTDSKWPITANVWSHNATDSTAPKTLTVYDTDVADGAYFDTNKGYVGTVYSLPDIPGQWGFQISSISYYSQDTPAEIGSSYSLASDDAPLEPLVQSGLQGLTLNIPYTLEQVHNVTYQVSSSTDASEWSEWVDLASVPVTTNTTGTYIHRTISDTTFFRYRAIYEYTSEGKRVISEPSDYVVAGRGVITPGGLDQLPGGVTIPIQKPGEGPDPTSEQSLKWADATTNTVIGADYGRLIGNIGNTSSLATRGINVYNPATPLYRQASLELEANMATPLVRVRAGNYSRVILDSRGNTDFTGGGTGDVGTGRLFFFI